MAVDKAILVGAFFGLGLSFGLILCTVAQILKSLKATRDQVGQSLWLDLGFAFALWLAALPLLVLAIFGKMYMGQGLADELGPLISIASAVGVVVLLNQFVFPSPRQKRV